jgi:7-carboxy-7-deazaguanine synthase (Cx14CxxC type)
MYSVKEIFYTLQGEGAQSGRPAVFCRFSGCNLWSGLERDRANAICKFCDTDFVGIGQDGGKFASAAELADAIDSVWPGNKSADCKYVVCTGGEPLLQLDKELIAALHDRLFDVAVETNGTIDAPEGLDWVCVSPKAWTLLKIRKGNELKLVYPQLAALPGDFEELDFQHFYVQPMDGAQYNRNLAMAIDYCKDNPRWKLSLQTHKVIQIR